MKSSDLADLTRAPLVADTSVIINLLATGQAAAILRALPSPLILVEQVMHELANGCEHGHDHPAKLAPLCGAALATVVALPAQSAERYRSLVDGQTTSTLGDGEAGTIALAVAAGGTAIIDERKALRVCADQFPTTPVLGTTDILMSAAVVSALGDEDHRNAVVSALTVARMRVPSRHLEMVRGLIGTATAAKCFSLPRFYRP